jgi:hypothetical protein
MGIFSVAKNNFLAFEAGPSESFSLQWATYRDASDQTSLSRIWGGIHPPIDDIKGRIIGNKIGKEAFNYASQFFNGTLVNNNGVSVNDYKIYPNPVSDDIKIDTNSKEDLKVFIYSILGKKIDSQIITSSKRNVKISNLKPGFYTVRICSLDDTILKTQKIIKQ